MGSVVSKKKSRRKTMCSVMGTFRGSFNRLVPMGVYVTLRIHVTSAMSKQPHDYLIILYLKYSETMA
jgi:hypothetical protein